MGQTSRPCHRAAPLSASCCPDNAVRRRRCRGLATEAIPPTWHLSIPNHECARWCGPIPTRACVWRVSALRTESSASACTLMSEALMRRRARKSFWRYDAFDDDIRAADFRETLTVARPHLSNIRPRDHRSDSVENCGVTDANTPEVPPGLLPRLLGRADILPPRDMVPLRRSIA